MSDRLSAVAVVERAWAVADAEGDVARSEARLVALSADLDVASRRGDLVDVTVIRFELSDCESALRSGRERLAALVGGPTHGSR